MPENKTDPDIDTDSVSESDDTDTIDIPLSTGSSSEQPEKEAEPVSPEALQLEIATLKEQLLRKVAEFENFRRRTREEQSALIKYGNERLMSDLLPVIDDFERSIKAGKEHPDFESFYKGVEIVRNKLIRTLELRGLKPIEITGQLFDERFHDALLRIPMKDKAPGTIIDEVETGYMLDEKVIRHSKVTVAAEPTAESEN